MLGLLIGSAVLGFFLVSALPIGFQYAAEVTHPTPEGTSNGLMQLFGQASVIFVYAMTRLARDRRLVHPFAARCRRAARGGRGRGCRLPEPDEHHRAAATADSSPTPRPSAGP